MDDKILKVQRELRQRLFEGPTAIRWRPARELAAQLLLYLDDPVACWRLSTDWLREMLDADRVDGGYGGFVGTCGQPFDYVVLAEAQRNDLPLPGVVGHAFQASDPVLRTLWSDFKVTAIANVEQERNLTNGMRTTLQSIGTASKLALPLRSDGWPIGLICADWHRSAPRWDAEVCNNLGGLALNMLGPLLASAARLTADAAMQRTMPALPMVEMDAPPPCEPAGPAGWRDLTMSEQRVARLVATGLSYKEVARQIDRSLSTVDHHLRSIRDKLGARSTAHLVHLLNEQAAR